MESPVLDHDLCTKLSKYVTDLTNSGEKTLNHKAMKELKGICRKSDEYVEHVYHLVTTQLQRDHSEVRYSCLLIIDELFRRSHKFRNLLLADFQNFLELVAETDPEQDLPPPKAAAKNLKAQSLRFIQEWYNQFKDGYKLLVLGFNFLKDCKKVNFDDLAARSVVERQREEEANRKKELALQEKLDKTIGEMNERLPELNAVLVDTENAFSLIMPHPENFFISGETGEVTCGDKSNCINSNNSIDEVLRHHGIGNRSDYNLTIEVKDPKADFILNKDNNCIFESLKDLHVQVTQIFYPLVTSWLKRLTKAGSQEKLKETIDLKARIEIILAKFIELKIDYYTKPSPKDGSDCSDDDFEEVEEKPGFEPIIPQHLRKEYGLDQSLPSTSKMNLKATNSQWTFKPETKEEMRDPTSRLANIHALCSKLKSQNSTETLEKEQLKSEANMPQQSASGEASTSRKELLLSKAPRKNFDIDLLHWEEEKLQAPEIVKFDSLHRFWTPHDNESQLREMEDVASLRQRVIDYTGEFQPVKWTCRASLPSGNLCPRKDRVKCPFHGPVIPRDEMGIPVNNEEEPMHVKSELKREKAEEVLDWQDPELLRDLEAATGVNLKMPAKKGGRKKAALSKSKLTNIKVVENSTRTRLEKKVLNKGALKRVSEKLDTLDSKRHMDKFGNQWNYSFNT